MKKTLLTFILAVSALMSFAQRRVEVTDAIEFIKAIKDNTTIVVKKGATVNLSDALGTKIVVDMLKRDVQMQLLDVDADLATLKKGLYYIDEFDGNELIICGYKNLTIQGVESDEAAAYFPSIVIEPRYADVLSFLNCQNINLNHLIVGHTKEQGYCMGSVLRFENTKNVTVDRCSLFGCGTYGIEGERVSNMSVTNSYIHECSYGGTEIDKSHNLLFDNCMFYSCGEYGVLNIRTDDVIRINNSIFAGNQSEIFSGVSNVELNKCDIYHSGNTGEYRDGDTAAEIIQNEVRVFDYGNMYDFFVCDDSDVDISWWYECFARDYILKQSARDWHTLKHCRTLAELFSELYDDADADDDEIGWDELSSLIVEKNELRQYTTDQLRMMRNDIFAHHGYTFTSADLQKHFFSKSWYDPIGDNDKALKSLTEIELRNIQTIKEIEAERAK